MRRNLWFWVTIVLAAAALVASASLLVDYLRPAPVFCAAGGGCAKIQATAFARPLGIPLPVVGIVGLLALAFSALVPGRTARGVQLLLGFVGGGIAAALLVVQAKVGALCPFCAVVDVGAILLAGFSFVRWRSALDPPAGRLAPGLAIIGLLIAIALPIAIGSAVRTVPSGVPAPIAAEIEQTPRGKVTVVDFADFECPFCRMTHAELAPLLEARRDEVRVVRKQVPLRMHPHAMDAAKAAVCGESLGKGEEIADALFAAPPDQLTPEGCEAIAKAHGLDVERFRACVNAPSTAERIERDREAFRASGAQGLPTIWIDGVVLEGAQDRATLEAALDAAIRAR